jgi:hypothetical protein
LIRTIEEFDILYALDLSIEFCDVKNATRICLVLNNYQPLHNLLNIFKGEARRQAIHESMNWLIEDYIEQHKKRKLNEPFTYSLQLFDIFCDTFDEELLEFLDKYPNLKLIFHMKKGDFNNITKESEFLQHKADTPLLKKLLKGISTVNDPEMAMN